MVEDEERQMSVSKIVSSGQHKAKQIKGSQTLHTSTFTLVLLCEFYHTEPASII